MSTSEAFCCSGAARTANVTDGGVREVQSKQVLLFVQKSETVPKCTQHPQARNIHGTAIIRRTAKQPLVSRLKTKLARHSTPVPADVLGRNNHFSCTEACISFVFLIHRRDTARTTELFLSFTETDDELIAKQQPQYTFTFRSIS